MSESVRTPPSAIEMETAVIGACLIEREAIDRVSAILKPDDFYAPANRTAFEAILTLYSKDEPVELLSVKEQLERIGVLENMGGVSYLFQCVNAVPAAANAAYYARCVEEKSILRGLIASAADVETLAYKEYDDISQVLSKAETTMKTALRIPSGTNTTRDVAEVVTEAFEETERRHNLGGGLPGISTGLFGLDYYLGGLEPQKMVVIGGRSSMGKSALGCTIVRNVLRSGRKVMAFSIEVDEKSFVNRLLSIDSGVHLRKIRLGCLGDEDWRLLGDSAGWLSEAPLTVDARSGVTTSYIRNKVRNFKADGGEVVCVDHMHIISPETKTDNEASMWAQITRDLFEIGREFDLPMVVLAQFNRESEKRGDKRPVLSDFQGSGGIEQNAFTALGVYRPSYHARKEGGQDTPEVEEAEIYIMKQRDGATGVVNCKFHPHVVTFVDDDPNGVEMKRPTHAVVRESHEVYNRSNPVTVFFGETRVPYAD